MRRFLSRVAIAILAIWGLLNIFSNLDEAQSVLARQSVTVKTIVALASAPPWWVPAIIFVLGVLAIIWVEIGLPFWPESNPPELTPFSTKIIGLRGKSELSVRFKNVGKSKAFDTQTTFSFWRCSGERSPFSVRKSIGNPIAPEISQEVTIQFDLQPVEPIFVMLSFAFRSRPNGKLKQQNPNFYYKWDGLDRTLVHASEEERDLIVQRFKADIPPVVEFRWTSKTNTKEANEVALTSTHRRIVEGRDPQPIFIALDELKNLLNEGTTMLAKYQVDAVPNPTFLEVEDYRKRTLDAVRQQVLALTPKDLATFQQRWDEKDVLQAQTSMVDHGFLKDRSPDLPIYCHLWGRVQRLKQLISVIESR